MEWTWTGTGQEGLFNRRRLQTVKEELRAAAIARQCARLVGSRDLIRVQDLLDRNTTEGTAPDLFDRSRPFALHCTTTVPLPESTAGAPLRFPFPYRDLGADLRLDPPHRRSLYQLQYPVEHVAVIEVRAPEGLVPGQPPADIRVEAPCCGSYARTVTRTDTGYRVERRLTLPRLRIAAAEAANFGEFMEKVRVGDEAALEFGESGDNRTN
jgi:hypothetical protein